MTSEAKAPEAAAPERLEGKDQEFKLVPIEKVVPSKSNPRKTFDPVGLEKLAASIKETGIHEPLIMRPQNGHFEIVAGERRYLAAKKAGLYALPAMIRKLTDQQALEIQIIENLQREDVHPLEEADGFRALLATKAYTVESLAQKIGSGKSVGYVYAKLKLASLTQKAKQAFLDGHLTEGHAILIARLDPKDQEEALDVCWTEDGWGKDRKDYLIATRDLGGWIQRHVYLELDKAAWDLKDAALLPKAGACSACPKKAGGINAPQLEGFEAPDLKKEVCTDRVCYQAKIDALLKRRMAEISAKGHQVKLVSTSYSGTPKGMMGHGTYRRMELGAKPCEKTVKGLVGHGDGFNQVLNVCTALDCRIPGHGIMPLRSAGGRKGRKSGGSSGDSSGGLSPSAQDELRREKQRIDEAFRDYFRLELFEKIVGKTREITREDLELLAVRSEGLPYLDGRKNPSWMPPDLGSAAAAAKGKDVDLAKFLVAGALNSELDTYSDGKLLIAVARRHKLPIEEILGRNKTRAKNEELHRQQVKRWEGRVAAQASSYDEPTCKACGCIEKKACPGGCSWAKLNEKTNVGLCSTCEEASKRR